MPSRKRERTNDDGERQSSAEGDATKKLKTSVVVGIDNKPVSSDVFKEIVKTAIEEGMTNLATRISVTLEKSMESFADRVEEVISSSFETILAEFSSNVKEIARSNVEEATADLVSTVEDLKTNVQLLRNRVQRLELSLDQIR